MAPAESLIHLLRFAEVGLRLKDPSVSGKYLAAVLSAAFLFSFVPYVLELRRGLRARRRDQAM